MEPEERFERIEATLARSAEDHRRAMAEIDKRLAAFNQRHEAAMARMDRADAREQEHHRRAMQRMDRSDKKLEATRKLVSVGMEMITRLAVQTREARADTKALKAELRAFIKAQGNGHGGSNGQGRH